MAQWIAACKTDDIDHEDVIPFDHGDRSYAVYRSADDVYYATDGFCTHARASLCDGLVSGTSIECPKHSGRFDYTTGEALGRPATVDLRSYRTRVEDGIVYLEVD